MSVAPYGKDSETRIYFYVLLALITLTVGGLWHFHYYNNMHDNLLNSIFQVVSLSTTTGFTSTDFSVWPSFIPMLLMYGAIVGGCAGSTTGGIKIIRITLICKQGLREVRRLIHPRAEFPLKFDKQVVSFRIVDAVWGFIGIYLAIFVFLFLSLLLTGLDLMTALSSLIACLSNLGPGLGRVTFHYASLPWVSKSILAFAMLLGRLEIFTVLVLFMPSFWRK